MAEVKKVTYELFDILVIVSFIGGCGIAYEEDQTLSAILETLESVTLRAYAEAHDLMLYVRPIGGAWKRVITIRGGGTDTADITDFVKDNPNFEIRAEHCVPWFIFGTHRISGAMEVTYAPPPEVTAPTEYTGEMPFGEPTFGVMFEYMMNMMMMFMMMSMMMAMMSAMAGVIAP